VSDVRYVLLEQVHEGKVRQLWTVRQVQDWIARWRPA
jgi:hypothetical protein